VALVIVLFLLLTVLWIYVDYVVWPTAGSVTDTETENRGFLTTETEVGIATAEKTETKLPKFRFSSVLIICEMYVSRYLNENLFMNIA